MPRSLTRLATRDRRASSERSEENALRAFEHRYSNIIDFSQEVSEDCAHQLSLQFRLLEAEQYSARVREEWQGLIEMFRCAHRNTETGGDARNRERGEQ